MINLPELNALLKPFNISLECYSCEVDPIKISPPKPPKNSQSAKKISKKSTKAQYRLFSEKKTISTRKGAMVKKSVPAFNCIFDDDIMVQPEQFLNRSNSLDSNSSDFFNQFKQTCDSYKNIPQFDNVNNCETIKSRDFDIDTAVSSFELSEHSNSVHYDDMRALKKDLFTTNNMVMESMPSFGNEGTGDFELDFDQHENFTEFFRFD